MKFRNFGKALLMTALSAGVVLGVTSCVQSYTVGFLYVTGTVTAQSSSNGIITGFKIDHNTGKLTPIAGLPVSSGGANPVRAVLITGSRFLYVLNRGANSANGSNCTTADPCENANITQFAVGANGILTPQETFYPTGGNPFRLIGDSTGNFLYVLDHDSPSSAACALALGSSATACGDIEAYQINQTTGRLQLIVNAQVTAANGSALPNFPVPANPIDFLLSGGNIFTLSGTPATGDSVFPYTFSASSGQLTVNQNSSQPLTGVPANTGGLVEQARAIVAGGGAIYILDDEPITSNGVTSPSQLLPYSVGVNGALLAQTTGVVPDDPTLSNPIYLIVSGKYLYVANQGDNTSTNNGQSGIAGYVINPSTYQLTYIPGEPWGTGGGPQCLVADPSSQFIYTANFNDSTVTGEVIDPNSGTLKSMRVASTYSLTGPATWCVVDGRTS